MARLMFVFTADEIRTQIPYQLICETMGGAIWETGRRKRRWLAEFTESERKACSKLYAQAYKWYLRTGVPKEVTMEASTHALWKKLEAFCLSL